MTSRMAQYSCCDMGSTHDSALRRCRHRTRHSSGSSGSGSSGSGSGSSSDDAGRQAGRRQCLIDEAIARHEQRYLYDDYDYHTGHCNTREYD